MRAGGKPAGSQRMDGGHGTQPSATKESPWSRWAAARSAPAMATSGDMATTNIVQAAADGSDEKVDEDMVLLVETAIAAEAHCMRQAP